MKIVADENMPAVTELFSAFGDVVCLPGRSIGSRDIADADVLLVRSVTAVNKALLSGSAVRFVGSATIGTDHVDRQYLADKAIPFVHAPGCNADAVVDYVLATLFSLDQESWFHKTVAIVGCGNVGSRLYKRLSALGVNCLCYDPFLSPEQQPGLCGFSRLREADVLCLHTPLTRSGPYPTWHMFDEAFMATLKPGALLVNAGRGAVIDNSALPGLMGSRQLRAALDVWEGEPAIQGELLGAVDQGTPHIAGYSLEGRLRGTLMVYQGFCAWLGVEPEINGLEKLLERYSPGNPESMVITCPGSGSTYERLRQIVLSAYDPAGDFRQLKAAANDSESLAQGFDRLRKNYPLRREFSFHSVTAIADTNLAEKISALGFRAQV